MQINTPKAKVLIFGYIRKSICYAFNPQFPKGSDVIDLRYNLDMSFLKLPGDSYVQLELG